MPSGRNDSPRGVDEEDGREQRMSVIVMTITNVLTKNDRIPNVKYIHRDFFGISVRTI